jgi:glycosyltransferase involved in cell wall biosynthesis
MKPLVSILIPAYNAQEFLSATIRSAVGQTWDAKEIIIVDDGSRDETLRIAKRFESGNVKVVSQANQGAAATRNTALSIAQGEFIQWLDADDLLAPDKIEAQIEIALRTGRSDVALSSPWAYFMYRPVKARFKPTALWEDMSPLEWLTRKMEHNLHMQTATWLVSRQLTQVAGPWNTTLLGDDDGEYFARILKASSGVKFVRSGGVLYRDMPSNRLSYIGRDKRRIEAQFLSMEKNIRYLRSMDDSPRVRTACVTYLQNWLFTFYPEHPELVERMHQLAGSLGGTLSPPRLTWKYSWIQQLFGWSAAKVTQDYYNRLKGSALRSWDKALFRLAAESGLGSLSS